MLRRGRVLLAEGGAGSAAGYDGELKARRMTRGIDFTYSKQAQKLEEMGRQGRAGGIRRVRDVLRDTNKIEPAIVSLTLDLPSKTLDNSRDVSKDELSAMFKDRVMPLKRMQMGVTAKPSINVSPRQLQKDEQRREYFQMVFWIVGWALAGASLVHHFFGPSDLGAIPLLEPEELEGMVKNKERRESERRAREAARTSNESAG
ncbi:hypothetical protein DIPPA_16076 [Diplonema papillatum]|nr:hypothetical protein DIPPA_16076 [Diplonema papillatum]